MGDHGCEYMTGGVVVCLGDTGRNFGAGMSGGEAYIYDPESVFPARCNMGMVSLEAVLRGGADEERLKTLIERHVTETGSEKGRCILDAWEDDTVGVGAFVKVMPDEYARVLKEIASK